MKTQKQILLMALLLVSGIALAQQQPVTKSKKNETAMNKTSMNTYVIERQIPEAGKLTPGDLQGISQKSCTVLRELGPGIEWVQSYVTDNKIYCIYRAENEAILRTHAEKGGFPINSIEKLSTIISPATATAPLAEIKN